MSFVNSGSCSALILFILEPNKQLSSPQITKYRYKRNNTNLKLLPYKYLGIVLDTDLSDDKDI